MGDRGNVSVRAQLVLPEQRQLFDYWLERSGARHMPDRSDIRPSDFPRLLPHVSLIDVLDQPKRFRVRLAGTRLRDIYDRETTGLFVEDFEWGDKRDYWVAAYERLIVEGKPSQGIVRGPRLYKEHLVQYWLRLPLSVGNGRVQMILCYDAFLPAVEISASVPAAMSA
jgi:PAS domain